MLTVGDCSVRSVWTSWGRTNHVPSVGRSSHSTSQTIEVSVSLEAYYCIALYFQGAQFSLKINDEIMPKKKALWWEESSTSALKIKRYANFSHFSG